MPFLGTVQDPEQFQKQLTQTEFKKLEDKIQEKYEKMYEKNSWIKKKKSQPTYLQSKIYRAKERLDIELANIEVVKDPEDETKPE